MANNLNLEKGVRLEQYKNQTFIRPLLRLRPPETVAVPLISFGGGTMLPIPRVGESVAKNSMLARSKSGKNWVVAPLSGKLSCIERVEHPLLGSVLCAFLKVKDNIPPLDVIGHDPSAMSAAGVIQTARMAGIIDETDGLPLYYKLQKAQSDNILIAIADGIDDTPYITSALKTVSEYGDRACDGVGLVLKVLGGGKAVLAVHDPGDLNMETVTGSFGFTDVMPISGGYPAWPRFKRQYCGDRPCLRVGVQALRALSMAVREGFPQLDSIITIAGDCIRNPANIIVPTGVPVSYILDQCGLVKTPNYVILGDTMTGVTCADLNVPVMPGIRGICAMSELPAPSKRTPCISCGRCVEVCPERLFPSEAVRLYAAGKKKQAMEFGCSDCIGCGACSAVCPAGVEVSDIMLELAALSGD